MAIFRTHKNEDYTVMSNHHLNDPRMSLKAKGLLSFMLSKPDGWHFSIRGLESQLKEGKDSVATTMKELIDFKYVIREQGRSKGSFGDIIYHIYESPCTENPDAVNPDTGNPRTETPPQVNTKEVNTKEVNTKKEKINKKDFSAVTNVIDYLNKLTKRNFRESSATVRLIKARLKEYTEEDLKKVVKYKVDQWINDSIMKPYLRPSTLFNATKFENYINEVPQNLVVETKKKDNNDYIVWMQEPELVPEDKLQAWFGKNYSELVSENGTVKAENIIISKLMEQNAKGNI
jgi:uncharacterized phage protein (TIGR02220 family)